MIVRKNMAELEKMRAAGLLVWQILDKLRSMVREGVTTYELEVEAEKMMAAAGARPAFKGYTTPAAGTKFPFVLCTSVNDEIVHGMPSNKRVLKSGDIVSIDTGVELNGYYGDSALTVPVGEIADETQRLLEVTRESLELAIDKARAGNRLFDICGTVERHVTASGFTVVREFVGHGIGTHMHEEPQIPNYIDRKNENPRLKEGMVLAIEPMVNAGEPGSPGATGPVDGGDRRRQELGALRAHRGDYGERSMGSDQAVSATVVELLPSAGYTVKLENEELVRAHAAGAGAANFVRLRPGDRVRVELSTHDRTRGRIVEVLKRG